MLETTLLAKALLAYSVHEHQEGYVTEIAVWLGPFTVQDNGRGMGLDRGGYVENLMGSLVASIGALQLHGIGLPSSQLPHEAGSRVSFKFAVGAPKIDRIELTQQVDFWRERNTGLIINVYECPAA